VGASTSTGAGSSGGMQGSFVDQAASGGMHWAIAALAQKQKAHVHEIRTLTLPLHVPAAIRTEKKRKKKKNNAHKKQEKKNKPARKPKCRK
jgi:hypothetical protein